MITLRSRQSLIIGIGLVGAILLVFLLARQVLGRQDDQKQGSGLVMASGSDRFPSQSAVDWVTYADYVVVVRPTDDEEVAPSAEEVEHGEGVILRNVELTVTDVLWSTSRPPRDAPRTFEWTAYGWAFNDGSTTNRVEMAGEDEPRIELGHTYIMAIEWVDARCSPGDERIPAQWRGLGDDAVIPFDNGLIGEGELEGHDQTVAQAESSADPKDPNFSLEDQMAGLEISALVEQLRRAQPVEKGQFGPPASATQCP